MKCQDCKRNKSSLTVVSVAHCQYLEICKPCFTKRETRFAKQCGFEPRPYRAALTERAGVLRKTA